MSKFIVLKNGKAYVCDEHWVTINGGEPDAYHVLIKGNKAYHGPSKIKRAIKQGVSKVKSFISRRNENDEDDGLNPKKIDVGDYKAYGKNDIISKGKPMSHAEADSGNVNPKYNGEDNEFSKNCHCCIVAYELRRRGYDVEARHFTNKGNQEILTMQPYAVWRNSETGKIVQPMKITGNYTLIKNTLKSTIEPGGRYHAGYDWIGGGNHLIVIEKDKNGILRAYDPQSNKNINLRTLIEEIDKSEGMTVYRVDNARFDSEMIKELLTKRRK